MGDTLVPRPGEGGAFASLLAGCRPLFPPALMGDAGWRRLLDRAALLPASVVDMQFGFEFHLAEAGAEADLCVAALPGSELSRHYVREGARAAPGSAAAALGAGLREQTANPGSYLADSVDAVVLEYDLAGLAPRRPPPAPGVFFVPRKGAPASRRGFTEHRDPARLLAALAAAVGWRGAGKLLRSVERIVAALPEPCFLFQAGALPARSPRAVRLVVGGVAKNEVSALLERLEWPGPTAAAADVLAGVDDVAASVAVSLDATARGPGARLGLELYRPRRWCDVDRAGWRPFIARLEERGWCLPAKADGLRRWPRTERLLGGGEVYHVRQGINHVKVVVRKGARTVAKAYAAMDVIPYGSQLRPPAALTTGPTPRASSERSASPPAQA